jgi:hypothetical protein
MHRNQLADRNQLTDQSNELTADSRVSIIEKEIREIVDNAIMNMTGLQLNFTAKLYRSERINFTVELTSKYITELNNKSKTFRYSKNNYNEVEIEGIKMMEISYNIVYK